MVISLENIGLGSAEVWGMRMEVRQGWGQVGMCVGGMFFLDENLLCL
jgi:hypothetical protein